MQGFKFVVLFFRIYDLLYWQYLKLKDKHVYRQPSVLNYLTNGNPSLSCAYRRVGQPSADDLEGCRRQAD